jgi:Phosphotransferase enzyme family
VPADGLRLIAPSSSADLARFRDILIARRPPASGVVAEAHAAALAWWDGPQVRQFAAIADPVVGHGDPNLSNYLWDGARVRIVDFEDAGRSDMELELANLVEHMSSRDTDWDEFVNHFPVDGRRFRAARVLWASCWLTMLMPGGPSAHRNPPGNPGEPSDPVPRSLSAGHDVGRSLGLMPRAARLVRRHYANPCPASTSGSRNWLLTRALSRGAGDGNRTRMASLEGWGSAIELHPRTPYCWMRRADMIPYPARGDELDTARVLGGRRTGKGHGVGGRRVSGSGVGDAWFID